jgi:hypothetical protein
VNTQNLKTKKLFILAPELARMLLALTFSILLSDQLLVLSYDTLTPGKNLGPSSPSGPSYPSGQLSTSGPPSSSHHR